MAAGLAAQGSFEVKITWGTSEVDTFVKTTLGPQVFQYLGDTSHRQHGSLKIWPYAVVSRQGKTLTAVDEFRPTGKTLRDSLHNGGATLRRAIKLRTIYLGMVKLSARLLLLLIHDLVTRNPINPHAIEDMFRENPTACPVVRGSTPISDHEMLEGPSSKPYKGKAKAKSE